MTTFIVVVIAIVAGAAGNLFIKLGTQNLPTALSIETLAKFANPTLLFGIFLMIASFPFYSMTLQRLPLSYGFPILMAGTFITVLALSFLVLKEPLTWINFFGILLLIVGLFLVAQK